MTDHGLAPLGDGEVIVTTAARRNCDKRYHSDPSCRYVGELKTPRVRQRDTLGDDWDECAQCADTVATGEGEKDWSAYHVASRADAAEVFDDD